jgi:uncharacterized protein (DUF362 family)
MSMRRREILQLGALSLAACHAPVAPSPALRVVEPEPPTAGSADVAVVEGDDHLATLARAIELVGGLGTGATALIKVNTNSGDPYPYSSSPAAVSWLTKQLRARGARVVVGDRSFWGDRDTAGNLEANGIAGAARDAGAEVLAFEPDATEWLELAPGLVPTWVAPVRVPRLAIEADVLVNLACMKTHFITGATLTMKNLLGIVHPDDRRREGNLRTHHHDRIHVQVREIHAALQATRARRGLDVIDGHRALVSGGPTPGSGAEPTIESPRVVVASTSRVGCDVFGLALLRRHALASEEVMQAAPWHGPILQAARVDAPASLRAVLEGVRDADELLAAVNDGAPLAITRA